jgi:uncharacterized protein YabN with tetrapyrrole methylase and pyrophosphatase domain
MEDKKLKEKILKDIKDANQINGHNSMGVSESWYNKYYMVREFAKNKGLKLENLSIDELNNLLDLADFSGNMFY